MPCPRCGADLRRDGIRSLTGIDEPVRSCSTCGLGVGMRRGFDRSLRERLDIPLCILRLVVVLAILGTIALVGGALVVLPGFQMLDDIPGPAVRVGRLVVLAAIGGVIVVACAPHRSGPDCAAAWLFMALGGTTYVLIQAILGEGPDWWEIVRFDSMTGGLVMVMATGAIACLLAVPLRDRMIRAWPADRGTSE